MDRFAFSHRQALSRGRLVGVLFLLAASSLTSLQAPPALAGASVSMINAQLEVAIKDCREQLEAKKFNECIAALKAVEIQLGTSQTQELDAIRAQVAGRLTVAEAYKTAGELNPDKPDAYYRTILKAYAAIPEAYFPFDEVLPLWNQFLREDTGRARFARYRKLKLIARGPKEDKALEDTFYTNIQQRLLDFGFSLLDPTNASAAQPDVLLKLGLKGESTDDAAPRLQFKKAWRLTLDIQAFKFMAGGMSQEPTQVEIEEAGNDLDTAREKAILKGCERTANMLFYQVLRALFPPGGITP